MDRRWLYGALIVFAMALLIGSGSFSATSADRGVDVAVAPDSSAFVGYAETCDGNALNITITNRFDSSLTDGTVIVNGTVKSFESLGVGKQVTMTFDDSEPGDPVSVFVEGTSHHVDLDRSVSKSCSPTQGVRFPGKSQGAVIHVEDANGTYWTLNASQEPYDQTTIFGRSLNVDSDTIVAVYVHATETTYVHPDLVRSGNGTYTLENGNGANEPCTYPGNVSLDDANLSSCP